jgi:hypothetical protein
MVKRCARVVSFSRWFAEGAEEGAFTTTDVKNLHTYVNSVKLLQLCHRGRERKRGPIECGVPRRKETDSAYRIAAKLIQDPTIPFRGERGVEIRWSPFNYGIECIPTRICSLSLSDLRDGGARFDSES